MWTQAAHALVRSRQANAQPLQPWFSRVVHRRGLRTALAAVPMAILSALVFCPAVLSTLTSISVTPKNQNISTGQTQQYTAMGNYSDASTNTNNITDHVTWSSSSTSVATINSSGLATALAAGTTTISATLSGKTSSASLTVSNPVARGVFCGGKNATATLPNCDPNNPTANTVFDTTMPDTSSYPVVQVNSGGDLQAAINSASCNPNGTIIKLQAGATFNSGFGSRVWGNGPYQLPKKTCAAGQWIIIQSDGSAGTIPPPGMRVDPTVANLMPKIQATGGLPAIIVSQGANHYRFIGVEFNVAYAGAEQVSIIELDTGATSSSQLAHHFVFDRIYCHGDTNLTHDFRRCIDAPINYLAVIESYINQIHDTGADSQTVLMWGNYSTGPFKIVNNYLSSSGENVLSGGAGGSIIGAIPSDFEVRHNHFFKPTTWRGTPIVTKNLFELKDAQRVLLDGNVFENTWLSGQTGWALVFTSSADSGPNPVVQDVIFTHNIVRHAANGMQLAPNPGAIPPTRMLFQNNLFVDINNDTWSSGDQGWYAEHFTYTTNIVHDHNTVLESGTLESAAYFFLANGGGGTVGSWQFTNMLINHGVLGVNGDRSTTEGTQTLNSFAPGYVWNKNVLINNTDLSSIYPPGTFFPTSSAVQFTDYTSCSNGTSTGNCVLLPGSRYHNAGTDGKDIGADIDSINNATAGVIQAHD